jgi:hypothetical protein
MLVGAMDTAGAADWQHALTPYLWGAAMSGTAAVGPVEADVDVGFSDILDHLKIGGMLSYRGENDRLVVLADAIYMDLEADKTSTTGPIRIDSLASMQQTAIELDVGRRVTERLVGFAGLRYIDLDADVQVGTTGPGQGLTRAAGARQNWIDPVIGAIADFPLSDRWSLDLRGDIGGFGVGSNFAWQAMVTVNWRATKTIDVVGAYRYIDMDYDNGSGPNYFKYDMVMAGPSLGVTFRF